MMKVFCLDAASVPKTARPGELFRENESDISSHTGEKPYRPYEALRRLIRLTNIVWVGDCGRSLEEVAWCCARDCEEKNTTRTVVCISLAINGA